MSSATRSDPTAARELANAMGEELAQGGDISREAMSPRQRELDNNFSYYRATQYDSCRVDWNGHEVLGHQEHEYVVQAGFVPPGFYDAGQTSAALPLKFRKPTAPYQLGRVIVDRFTALLFSNRRNPRILVEGDPDTEDYVNALAEACRLWSVMARVRTMGGAMGSVALGFQFIDGLPVLEVFDPRISMPNYLSRRTGDLRFLEQRYIYTDTLTNAKGESFEANFWWRRVLDHESDTVWPRVACDGEVEPNWDEYKCISRRHDLGFCPVVWVQNDEVPDAVDGDSDLHGVHDLLRAIDALVAQANRGVIRNCDPTVMMSTDADLESVQKGSDNAIKLEKGGSAQYMEIAGTGPKLALEMAKDLEERVLRVTRCYLDSNKSAGAKSVVEVERNYSAMIERADLLREQYGEKCVKPLLSMMLYAARQLTMPRKIRDESNVVRLVQGEIRLPPKVVKEELSGRAQFVPRKLGPSNQVSLKWPSYFHPTLDDAQSAVRTAAMARAAGLIDDEKALQFIAPYFQVEDLTALLAKIRKVAAKEDDEMEAELAAQLGDQARGIRTR